MLSKMEVIRQLGENIIAFLAQLENFQKKLWLKKKFVTETNYCITLDRLADQTDLLELVFDNENQLADWQKLYALDLDKLDHDYEALSWEAFLAKPEYRYLMLDTRHFDEAFKAQLLATIEDLDDQCDGLLVHSENFQALNLLQERYKEQVKCIYIDPPYNTGEDGFVYKDTFQHSSWMTMFTGRALVADNLLRDDALFMTSIDRDENRNLVPLLVNIFGENRYIEETVWQKSYGGGSKTKLINNLHEYVHIFGKNVKSLPKLFLPPDPAVVKYYKLKDEHVRTRGLYRLQPLNSNSNDFRENLTYPLPIPSTDVRGKRWEEERQRIASLLESGRLELIGKPGSWSYTLDGEPWMGRLLFPPRQWQWQWQRMRAALIVNGIEFTEKDGGVTVDYKQYRYDENGEERGKKPQSINVGPYTQSGTDEIRSLFNEDVTKFPKPLGLIQNFISIDYKYQEALVLDYFAGSGTTGHAVINLNREDNGNRKYILVEMGDYFDTVLKPRIQKVVYADTWKAGSPVADKSGNMNGVSHCFKTIRLESYEDALGNLALNRQKGQQDLIDSSENSDLSAARQSYVMNYMLEVETRGSASLLNSKLFVDPTGYQLNVRSASGDETKAVNIDLLETFNYLLGLTVEHIAAPVYFDAELTQGEFGRWQANVKRVTDASKGKWWFRTVYGTNRNGQSVLVVWRNLPSVIAKGEKGARDEKGLLKDNAVLDAVLIEKLNIRLTASQDDEIDILYVNGDHNINIPKNRKGELMEQARIQLIEEAFHRLMFAGTESDLPGKV